MFAFSHVLIWFINVSLLYEKFQMFDTDICIGAWLIHTENGIVKFLHWCLGLLSSCWTGAIQCGYNKALHFLHTAYHPTGDHQYATSRTRLTIVVTTHLWRRILAWKWGVAWTISSARETYLFLMSGSISPHVFRCSTICYRDIINIATTQWFYLTWG